MICSMHTLILKNLGNRSEVTSSPIKRPFYLLKRLRKQKKELNFWLSEKKFRKQDKVTAVKEIYDLLKIPSLTERKINQYFTKGFDQLEKLSSPNGKELLKGFAENLIERQS